jgi:prophage maintenance system killer protein
MIEIVIGVLVASVIVLFAAMVFFLVLSQVSFTQSNEVKQLCGKLQAENTEKELAIRRLKWELEQKHND